MDKDTEIRRELHTGNAALRVREASEGEGSGRTIEGYAIRFDTPSAPFYSDETSEVREEIAPEAVTQELLDSSDIKFTLFHDRQLLLARSKKGKGTLSYTRDAKGVKFSFEAPATADGDKALELVRSGVIDGCSFAFSTAYYNEAYVERKEQKKGKRTVVTCRVKRMTGIYDMTLTPDPAYPATECGVRELAREILAAPAPSEDKDLRSYVRAMRDEAKKKL